MSGAVDASVLARIAAARTTAEIFEATPPAYRGIVVREALPHVRKPGRHGVVTAANLVGGAPRDAKPDILRALWAAEISQPAWAAALGLTWIGGSSDVVDAAGDRDTLRAWFARANLTTPPLFLERFFYSAEEIPARVRLYRGGTHAVPFLRSGYSWTPLRDTACRYALLRQSQHGGRASLIAGTFDRDQIVLATRTSESEYVLLDASDAAPVSISPSAMTRLAARASDRMAEAFDFEHVRLSLDSDAGWEGWRAVA